MFATAAVSASGSDPGTSGVLEGDVGQVEGVVVTVVWRLIGTWITLEIVSALAGLRVAPEQQREGLALTAARRADGGLTARRRDARANGVPLESQLAPGSLERALGSLEFGNDDRRRRRAGAFALHYG